MASIVVGNDIYCFKWHRLLLEMASTVKKRHQLLLEMASTVVENGIDCYKWHRLLLVTATTVYQRRTVFSNGVCTHGGKLTTIVYL